MVCSSESGDRFLFLTTVIFCNLDAVACLWSLQVVVSELEITALSVRVAALPLGLLTLLLSLLLNSFRFLLNQAETFLSAPFGVSRSIFRCKLDSLWRACRS